MAKKIHNQLPGSRATLARRITAIVPGFVVLLALGWVCIDLDTEQRVVLFRYLAMAFAGGMAFITPHLLYPDADKTLIQQLNLSPLHLFLHHFSRLRTLAIFAVLALMVLAFGDTAHPTADLAMKFTLFATGLLALCSILFYALYRFVTIGSLSQRWNEGKVGKQVFDSMEKMGKSSPVSLGMYPTFISTILVTTIGMMTVVASAAVNDAIAGMLPFVLLLALAVFRLYLKLPNYDRMYYQSDAFYDELFTNPTTATGESRAPATYNAVYWVPHRWRPAVWSQLVQLDRKRPMGRIIVLFSLTYCFLLYSGVPETWITGWMVFWVLSKNMLAWPTADARMSPPLFHWWMMPPHDWIIARFFLQIRWTLAVFLTVGVAALLSGSIGWTDVWFWTLFDVAVSAVSAYLLTRNNEYTFQNRYI